MPVFIYGILTTILIHFTIQHFARVFLTFPLSHYCRLAPLITSFGFVIDSFPYLYQLYQVRESNVRPWTWRTRQETTCLALQMTKLKLKQKKAKSTQCLAAFHLKPDKPLPTFRSGGDIYHHIWIMGSCSSHFSRSPHFKTRQLIFCK